MGGTGVIDNFLGVFTSYIDSGFGLLGGEVAFIATTLIVIDVTLAALFWSWGADDDIIARLVKKTLFVGVFAYLIGNWNNLSRIVFESFAGLGLMASGTGFSAADLVRPGKVAQVGLDAGRPLLESISGLMGYISFFENFIPALANSCNGGFYGNIRNNTYSLSFTFIRRVDTDARHGGIVPGIDGEFSHLAICSGSLTPYDNYIRCSL